MRRLICGPEILSGRAVCPPDGRKYEEEMFSGTFDFDMHSCIGGIVQAGKGTRGRARHRDGGGGRDTKQL